MVLFMSMIVNTVREELYAGILAALEPAVAAGQIEALPRRDFYIEVPQNRANGDLSANAALVWAKELKLPPRKLAELIVTNLSFPSGYVARWEVAGPGFLNFWLSPRYYADILRDIRSQGAAYGRSGYGHGQKINVEFVSANPTGPMHMGNARGGALGDCLAAVLDCAGYEVSREFYVNDAGNQIDKFALSLDIRYRQHCGDTTVELPEDSYHGEDIATLAKEFAAIHGSQYIEAPEAERREALVTYALPKNIQAMKDNLTKYRIFYDTWFHESSLYESGELAQTIALMQEKGLTYKQDGALWYRATEHGGEKDEVLIRANGNPSYFAADIAYHRNKLLLRGFDRAIDVWGADHHGHVARMKGALDAIGLDGSRLDILLMQMVNLVRDGEVVRMSKRTGKAITLVDLLEDIPIDAVRFFFNLREPATQMEFDLDLAVEQSAQNPVYYCQYAHARICSILKKLAGEGQTPRDCSIEELELLEAPEERELIRHLSALTAEIVTAAKNYDPARITRYCLELAALFHRFYSACRVNCEDAALSAARLFLCLCVKDTIKNILAMFKITVPDAM